MASIDPETSRLAPVRRRVARAKVGLIVGGTLVFGAAMALSRLHDAGHPKQHLRPLSASRRYLATVQANDIDAGEIWKALESPSAATHAS
jgi:hypothetical protein